MILFLVVSPWAFGGVDPEWQFAIVLAVFALISCWLLRCVVYKRMSFRPDWVSFGLSGLLCLSLVQLIPLPVAIVSLLSPRRAADYQSLVPEQLERIGDNADVARPGLITLSADPSLTRHFLAEIAVVLAVYLVARNWLATRNSVRRLAWIVTLNGFALACYGFVQFFLAEGKVYFQFSISSAFGPFICRNHYPFYAYIVLGLLLGLALHSAKSEYAASSEKGLAGMYQSLTTWLSHATQSPFNVILLSAAMVVAISIPFSLSRGGMVTLLVGIVFLGWLLKSNGESGNFAAVLVVAALAIGLGAWLGWGPIERRLAGLAEGGGASDSRSELWKSAAKIVLAHPLVGVGGNAYQRVEPAFRKPGEDFGTNLVNDSVHNEYLEAFVEGGPVRFLLTIAIAGGAVSGAIRAYRRLGSRSNGSIAAGLAFALVCIAVHSFFDFGIHLPAIALTAAVCAAYCEAIASDAEFAPTKRTKSTSGEQVDATPMADTAKPHRARAMTLVGPPAWAMAAVAGLAMVLILRQYYIWDRGERYRSAAIAASRSDGPGSPMHIALAEAAAGASPGDPELHLAMARAHFDAVVASTKPSTDPWYPNVPAEIVEKHVRPGLRAARTARSICPTLATSHMRFALYRNACETADPAATYLERAMKLAPCDPEAPFAAGLEAISRKQIDQAGEYWKRSLSLNGRQLERILKAAKASGLSPSQIRDRFLPDEPTVLLAAADMLYPDRREMADERKPFLDRARRVGETMPASNYGTLEALARIQHEMGDTAGAQKAWRKAVDLAPDNVMLRERYALWLEAEELIEPLVSELEWLKARNIGATTNDRLELARRLNDLRQILNK
jgi:O-antigen ligase/tetratricopeptide (TPR) repeat protein